MKQTFPGYYKPNADQYKRLWAEGLIVLDTNVLLNLYRLPMTARGDLLNVLAVLKDRIWVPHHVALEFQKRRLSVISKERKSTEDVLTSAMNLVSELKRNVDALQIDKRGLGIDSKPLLEALEKENSTLIDAIREVQKNQLDISSADDVRDRLDELLDGHIGVAPATQAELDTLVDGGDERYQEKIPPGFADVDKDKNPKEATFIHNHIKYQRKFGDLIIWRQTIQHAKSSGSKCIIFVTADSKDDWWWREEGKTIGVHPELVSEIQREADVDLFWMYSAEQFMEHAAEYTVVPVSSQSVEEIRHVGQMSQLMSGVRSGSFIESLSFPYGARRNSTSDTIATGANSLNTYVAVDKWLMTTSDAVNLDIDRFPHFLAQNRKFIRGVHVRTLQDYSLLLRIPAMISDVHRGSAVASSDTISEFCMIFILPPDEMFKLFDAEIRESVRSSITTLVNALPKIEIIVGGVEGGFFSPMLSVRSE